MSDMSYLETVSTGCALVNRGKLSIHDLIAAVRAGTPEQKAAIRAIIAPLFAKHETAEVKPKPARKEKTAELPDASAGVPTADDYRMDPEDIDHDVCIGRSWCAIDRRWYPYVLKESQCGRTVSHDGMCAQCHKAKAKAESTGKPGTWRGIVTEAPPDFLHMLGTKWAAKCKWVGDGDSSSDSDSDISE
jgi:hypothetical protein